ncbi:hypothetical protein U1707_03045 [Sphingomonas sp. PB2P12]|uniref:hypothetical protein n=1 Tax=Sphingomonas sandaracina TaxID=3096157 RepID=UPI002FC5FA08
MAIRLAMTVAFLLLASRQTSAATHVSGDARRLAAMTPAQFQALATLHDDDLDTIATVTTADGFVERRPLLGLAPDDVFLRAFIDKKTGRAAYQVYATMRYRGYGWADWRVANYAAPTGPRSIPTRRIVRLRGACSRSLPCPRSETIGFAVEAALLKANAALYSPETNTRWRFKVLARDGQERSLSLSTAEIAGLLMAVDAYRSDRHLPNF